MLTRRACELRKSSDAGMTLVELMVGMTLMTIVGAIALNFFVGTTKQANRVTDQSLSGGAVRTVLNQVVTLLRLSDTPLSTPGYSKARFQGISPTEIVFYTNVSLSRSASGSVRTPPTKVDIKLSSGVLTESLYAPTNAYTTYPSNYDTDSAGPGQVTYKTNYPASPTSKSILLSGVTNTDVFSFFSDQATATSPAQTTPSPSPSPCPTSTASVVAPAPGFTCATNQDSVDLVQIKLSVGALPGETAQTAQSSVAITGATS